MSYEKVSTIIDHLWSWCSTGRGRDIIKDSSRVRTAKYDCYIESNLPDPLSFSVFELSDKGELKIDDVQKVMDSDAAFFLFVNTNTGWIIAVKNKLENIKKLIKGESIQNFKVKIIP